MTEEQLIYQLKELNKIKPNKTWVVLAKMNILGSEISARREVLQPTYKFNASNIFGFIFQRKLAYAFAMLFFVFLGGLGFVYFPKQDGQVAMSPAAISAVKGDVEMLKTKSRALSQIAVNNPGDISHAVQEVKVVAKTITKSIKKDPGLAKEVALEINNNKTYLTVTGEDESKETLTELYKTIAEQLIKDLEDVSLTEDQKKSLERIKNLYDQEKFTDALEGALLLDIARESK